MEETASGVNPVPSTSMLTAIGPQPIVASRHRYPKFANLLVAFAIASVGKSNDGRFDGFPQFLDYVLRVFDQLHFPFESVGGKPAGSGGKP